MIVEELANLKPASTLMEPKMDFIGSKSDLLDRETTTRYRRVLGSLHYLTTTRPDISYAVSKLAQFFAHPSNHHWQGLQRVLRYISDNPRLLRPLSSGKIEAFSDADWAGYISWWFCGLLWWKYSFMAV